jgi:hypothetical protein
MVSINDIRIKAFMALPSCLSARAVHHLVWRTGVFSSRASTGTWHTSSTLGGLWWKN